MKHIKQDVAVAVVAASSTDDADDVNDSSCKQLRRLHSGALAKARIQLPALTKEYLVNAINFDPS